MLKQQCKLVHASSAGGPMDNRMHAAAKAGDKQLVVQLIGEQAPLDTRDGLSRTPLHIAAWAGHTDIVKLLLAHKCCCKKTAMDDMNALHFAAQKGHGDIVRALLTAGIAVNSKNRKGANALMLAAAGGHLDTVQLLLQRGANPLATNRKELKALDLASNAQIKELLLAAEAEAIAAKVANKQSGSNSRVSQGPAAGTAGEAAAAAQDQQQDGESHVAPTTALLIGPAGPPHTTLKQHVPDSMKRAADSREQQTPGQAADDQRGSAVGPVIGPLGPPPQNLNLNGNTDDASAAEQGSKAGDVNGGAEGAGHQAAPVAAQSRHKAKRQKVLLSFADEDD